MAAKNGATIIIGSQWGDEGKGKLVDSLSQSFEVVARCQGGANAGHTIVHQGKKLALHLIPSGILSEKAVCMIGNGVVVHLPTFFKEIKNLEEKGIPYKGRLFVSNRAHIVFDFHQIVDGLREQELSAGNKNDSIGTTRRGIGPTYSSKASRSGKRIGDLEFFDKFADDFRRMVENKKKRYGPFDYDIEKEIENYRKFRDDIRPFVLDTVYHLNKAFTDGKKVLIECAQSCMLDLDMGTYPYVTSSNSSIGGACTGLGISPDKITTVYGVAKAYTTRVGAGPFPTELHGDFAENLRKAGGEYGTTTGRPRRIGWFDAVVLRYTSMVNGFQYLNLTKLDVLSDQDEIQIGVAYVYKGQKLESFPANLEVLSDCVVEYVKLPGWKSDISKFRKFEELPKQAQDYVNKIEEVTGVRVRWIGVGQEREAMAVKNH